MTITERNDLIIKLAGLGLFGDKAAIVKLLEELAVKESKLNKRATYNKILNLIEKYSEGEVFYTPSSLSASVEVATIPDIKNIWLSPSVETKIAKFIKLHQGKLLSYSAKQFNKLLLYGPPGSGKTTIGFYIAHALGRQISYVKITDVISSRLGETMHNIAEVFSQENNNIIFIDEFDAFAKNRTDKNDVGELKRIVNSIVQTLDFYSENKIIIVATNLPESIDPAILRRFRFRILVDKLFDGEKESFFNYLLKTKKVPSQLKETDKKFLIETLDVIGIDTIDDIMDFFDKTLLNNLMESKQDLVLDDFVKTLFVDDYLKRPKQIRKTNKKILNHLCRIMETAGYPKTKIAESLDIHRNSYRNYAK